MKVIQPSINPTNKLTAAVVSVFTIEVVRLIANNIWPGAADESLWVAAQPIGVFVAGWFIKDDANVAVPVVVETPAPGAEDGKPA